MAVLFPAGSLLTAAALNTAIVDVGAVTNLTATLSTPSTSFINVTNIVLSFTKNQANTRLLVLYLWTGFTTSGGFNTFLTVESAMRVDAVDYVGGWLTFNAPTLRHDQMTGMALITGLTAGAKTLQLRARVAGQDGTASIVCDLNDRGSILCLEIPA